MKHANNLVAKHMHKANRAATHVDKKKQAKRSGVFCKADRRYK